MSERVSSHRRSVAGLAVVVLAAGAALAACGDSDDASKSGGLKTFTFVASRSPDEPIGLLVRLGGSKAYTDLAGDVLLTQDPKDGSLKPQLATSWKQIDDHNWEFVLREGVKFHNGEVFDAAAAAWAINKETAEDSPARVVRYARALEAICQGQVHLGDPLPRRLPDPGPRLPAVAVRSPEVVAG